MQVILKYKSTTTEQQNNGEKEMKAVMGFEPFA